MKLPDFTEFEPFNQLREAMGATQLGDFEFFDPSRHLTLDERNSLAGGWLASVAWVRVLADHTLAFKNSRVMLCHPEPAGPDDWYYHLASCDTVQSWLESAEPRLLATQVPSLAMGEFRVCADCLQTLRYKGFDAVRNRHRHYSLGLQAGFDLAQFWRDYPCYPLRETKPSPLL